MRLLLLIETLHQLSISIFIMSPSDNKKSQKATHHQTSEVTSDVALNLFIDYNDDNDALNMPAGCEGLAWDLLHACICGWALL